MKTMPYPLRIPKRMLELADLRGLFWMKARVDLEFLQRTRASWWMPLTIAEVSETAAIYEKKRRHFILKKFT